MLVLYNESNKPWEFTNVDEKYVRAFTSRTRKNTETGEENTRKISMYISSKIGDIDSTPFVSTQQPQILSKNQTNVVFKHKDCSAIITPANKRNKDILFITINLLGSIVTNIDTTNVFVLSNFIMNGELCLVVAVGDEKTGFTIDLHNTKENKDITYTFKKVEFDETDEKIGCNYVVSIDVEDSDKAIEVPDFKIKNFRPAKVTELVFSHISDVEALKNIEEFDENKHTIVTFKTREEFETAVKTYLEMNYKAVTLFVNLDNIKDEKFGIYKNNHKKLNNAFRYLNVLLNTGKVLKR